MLTEAQGKTTVTLISLYPSKEIRDQVLKTGMADGVAINCDRLEEYRAKA